MDDTFAIDWLGGNCPVQAEGTVDGERFYFRARGESWSFSIGGDDIVLDPKWHYEEDYGTGPYDAGWMTEDEARAFIAAAIERYRTPEPDDGQPTEQEEWLDFDKDC